MATFNLIPLITGETSREQLFDSTIIAIPDVVGRPASTWLEGSKGWLANLVPKHLASLEILEASYEYSNLKVFSWDKQFGLAESLLEQLTNRMVDPSSRRRPIFFVCHGIGGFIFKSFIVRLAQRYDNLASRALLSSIKAVVFLGCPHVTSDRPRAQEKLTWLIKACTGLGSRQIEQIFDDFSVVGRLGDRFQELPVDLAVISAYERLPTRISGSFLSSKRECLVDRSDAEVGMRGEQLIQVDSNHFDICDLQPTNNLRKEMTDLFTRLSNNAQLSQQALSQISDSPSYGIWQGTDSEYDILRSHPSINQPQSSRQGTLTSLMATAGSSDVQDMVLIPQITPKLTAKHPQAVRLPCHMFGPQARDPDFFGKEDILALLDESLLSRSEYAPSSYNGAPDQGAKVGLKTFALCGMAGVGKTQTALEFAYSRKLQFEAIFFVQAADTMKLAQSFSRICMELGLTGQGDNSDDQAVCRDSVLQWLSRPTRTIDPVIETINNKQETSPPISWLMIFDNADNLNILSEYWPVSGTGSVLITSRDPLAKTRSYVPSARGIDLAPLSVFDASKLLQKLTGYDNTKEDTEFSIEISRRLGGLPLAIATIAATITRRDLTFEEFLVLCQDEAARRALYAESSSDQAKNILTTFALGDLGPASSCLLKVLALLDPDQIFEGLLTTPLLTLPRNFRATSLTGFPETFANYTEARKELIRSSLIGRNGKEITVHRLVQDAVLMAMTAAEISKSFQAVVDLIYQKWPFGINDYNIERWKTCELLFPHVNQLRIYDAGSKDKIELKDTCGQFAHLLIDAGWYILERGNPLESVSFLNLAQKLLENLQSPDVIRLAELEHTYAEIYIYTGDSMKGKSHALRALELCIAADDPGHRLPQAYNEVAESQCNLHQYDAAIANCDHAIALYLEQEGYFAHFESSAFARINKAFCLWRKLQHEDASTILVDLLDSRRRMYGPDDTVSFKSGLALVTLGTIRTSQNKFDEGFSLHQKGHDQFLTTLGPWHFRVAGVLFYLAGHADRAKDWINARDKLLQSLKIYSQKSFYKAEIARTWFKLADIQRKLLDNLEAELAETHGHLILAEISREKNHLVEKADLDNLVQYWAL